MSKKVNSLCYKFSLYLRNLKEGFYKSLEMYTEGRINTFTFHMNKLISYRTDLELIKKDIDDNSKAINNASTCHVTNPKFILIIEKFRNANCRVADVS